MKRQIYNIFLFTAIVLFLSGCAFHSGIMTGSASIGSNNFKFVKTAQGHSHALYVLGFGGLMKHAMVAEAKQDLLDKNPLKDGQTLANVAVDVKSTFLVVIFRYNVTVTADIVEFK